MTGGVREEGEEGTEDEKDGECAEDEEFGGSWEEGVEARGHLLRGVSRGVW